MIILVLIVIIIVVLFIIGCVAEDPTPKDMRLLEACEKADSSQILHLLEEPLPLSVINGKSSYGATPLVLVCAVGNTQAAQLLIKRGAQLDCKNPDGHTALMLACIRGHTDIARTLIVAGSNVNAHSSTGVTPLTCAMLSGNVELISLLIKSGAKCVGE